MLFTNNETNPENLVHVKKEGEPNVSEVQEKDVGGQTKGSKVKGSKGAKRRKVETAEGASYKDAFFEVIKTGWCAFLGVLSEFPYKNIALSDVILAVL